MSTRWLTRNSRALAIVVVAAVLAAVVVVVMRVRVTPPHAPSSSTQPSTQPSASPISAGGYADAAGCATCHAEIARTYAATGMARGFSKLTPEKGSGVIFGPRTNENYTRPLFHKASNRYYTIAQRDGRLFQRRHQAGFEGRETNVLELEAHYVIGSGNHARTFLHRTPSGRLVQLPLSWYANEGQGARGKGRGYWEMSPGYDRPAHLDFRRVIDTGCMSCHNGYPRAPVEDDPEGPRFGNTLPEGIDCQRCHGPGQRHIDAIGRGDLDAGRRAIVNPSALNRERQLETCLQCHLESTSSPLPFQIRRYEHAPFSYVPGQALADYFLHFDHAPASNRDDKFEINSAGYRLRRSACFQKSEMTCVTCHDPHEPARGPAAATRYTAICEGCHNTPHPRGVPKVAGARAAATCVDCHMPKRRAEDAVHAVMTDHFIQRARPSRDLIAPRTEAQSAAAYRGEVVPYYPPSGPTTSPEDELYFAVAQVQDGSNLTAGLQRLQRAIERHQPERPEFYYQLARAYATAGDAQAVIRWCREALQRDAGYVPALKELAAAAMRIGQYGEAAAALEQAVARRPSDANALTDLGNAYVRQERVLEAERTLERALAVDASLPRAHNLMGLAQLKTGRAAAAETHFRDAIRLQPDLAEAHNNLGNLLAARRAYGEAGFHFAEAVGSDPNYVEAHHSYGVILALTKSYAKAVTELEAAIRLAPGLLTAHLDLAEVLVAMGRRGDARAHFDAAARSTDPEVRAAALAGLQAR
jgi:predicted CXXCH cytochrome family protein